MSAPMIHEYVVELAAYAVLVLFIVGAVIVVVVLGSWAARAFEKWRRPKL